MRSWSLRTVLLISAGAVLSLAAFGWLFAVRWADRAHAAAPKRDSAFAAARPYVDREPRAERPVRLEPDHPVLVDSSAGQPPAGVSAAPIPVLMYHEITQGPNALYVAPSEFAAHLDYLEQHGYQAVTMQQLYNHYTAGAKIPDHPVVLTFDDGYVSFATNAVPLLKKHNWPGTLFVITSDVGKPGYVTWEQVRDAARDGMEIGDHTISHPDLVILDPAKLPHEIADSRKVLQTETGLPINFFCYPAGRYNENVVKAVKEAGFSAAVTTDFGLADRAQSPYLWKRVRVNKGTTGEGLGALLKSAEEKH